MNNINRYKRLQAILKKLNQERKKQAKQIDILCNDMIAAQRDFIKRLKTIDFRAGFYESIIGTTDLNSLLSAATGIFKEVTKDANITFFLRQLESFEIFNFDDNTVFCPDKLHIEQCFNNELMTNICISNKICRIEDMFAMGLQDNLTYLNKISAAAIPLVSTGYVQGFILIYRSSDNKLTSEEISKISSVTSGLSNAIYSCLTLMHSSD